MTKIIYIFIYFIFLVFNMLNNKILAKESGAINVRFSSPIPDSLLIGLTFEGNIMKFQRVKPNTNLVEISNIEPGLYGMFLFNDRNGELIWGCKLKDWEIKGGAHFYYPWGKYISIACPGLKKILENELSYFGQFKSIYDVYLKSSDSLDIRSIDELSSFIRKYYTEEYILKKYPQGLEKELYDRQNEGGDKAEITPIAILGDENRILTLNSWIGPGHEFYFLELWEYTNNNSWQTSKAQAAFNILQLLVKLKEDHKKYRKPAASVKNIKIDFCGELGGIEVKLDRTTNVSINLENYK